MKRNRDVGTADDQRARFHAFCAEHSTKVRSYVSLCGKCPLADDGPYRCQFKWAQMPYKEGDAK